MNKCAQMGEFGNQFDPLRTTYFLGFISLLYRLYNFVSSGHIDFIKNLWCQGHARRCTIHNWRYFNLFGEVHAFNGSAFSELFLLDVALWKLNCTGPKAKHWLDLCTNYRTTNPNMSNGTVRSRQQFHTKYCT